MDKLKTEYHSSELWYCGIMAAVLSTICTTNEPSFLYPLHGKRSRFPLNHRLLIKLNLFMLSIRRDLAFVCAIALGMVIFIHVSRRAQYSTCFGEKSSMLRSFQRHVQNAVRLYMFHCMNASRPMKRSRSLVLASSTIFTC